VLEDVVATARRGDPTLDDATRHPDPEDAPVSLESPLAAGI
jgi:hypothetical protein